MTWIGSWRRRRILKGVLRQNRAILGMEPVVRRRRWRYIFSPGLAFALVLGGVLLLHSAYVNTLTRTAVQATTLAVDAARPAGGAGGFPIQPLPRDRGDDAAAGAGSAIPPAEYMGLAGPGGVHLKSVFGLGVRSIIIDPGHGGQATGAVGKGGTQEKDITLDIALKLRDMLQRNTAYRILMTREEDVDLSLKERVDLANARKADLFVSIHVNSLASKPLDIIETYFFGPTRDQDTLALAASENDGSKYSLSDYNEVIREIANQLKYQESRQLAQLIQSTLVDSMRSRNKDVLDFGVKRAPFVVLLGVDMPGVLVEIACLSNTEEEKRLRDPAYRESIAGYLERGIISYLNDRSSS